jgi:hypothetical protein
MEFVLENEEVEELLREALEGRGVKVPANFKMSHRLNNKKRTFRVVFLPKTERTRRPK